MDTALVVTVLQSLESPHCEANIHSLKMEIKYKDCHTIQKPSKEQIIKEDKFYFFLVREVLITSWLIA